MAKLLPRFGTQNIIWSDPNTGITFMHLLPELIRSVFRNEEIMYEDKRIELFDQRTEQSVIVTLRCVCRCENGVRVYYFTDEQERTHLSVYDALGPTTD